MTSPMESILASLDFAKTPLKRVKPANLDAAERVQNFLDSFDTIVTDCDGVLYVNNDPVPGVAQALNMLRRLGKKIIFATNNSTKTREDCLTKFHKLGIEAYLDEVFPTSYSTAVYLQSIGFNKKVYVVGSRGIQEECLNVGIEAFGVGHDPTPRHWTPGQCDVELDDDVGAVVVGFDNTISFPKLAKACSYARRPDCLFIASNADDSFPHPDPNVFVPGPGIYVAAIEAACGKEPVQLGKPFKYFFDIIRHRHPDIDPKRTVMIGDRLNTDMVFGRNNNLSTLHVQSGIGTFDDMNNFYNSSSSADWMCVPDYYLPSLESLTKYLPIH